MHGSFKLQSHTNYKFGNIYIKLKLLKFQNKISPSLLYVYTYETMDHFALNSITLVTIFKVINFL